MFSGEETTRSRGTAGRKGPGPKRSNDWADAAGAAAARRARRRRTRGVERPRGRDG
jgi:hypothetical protein